MDRPPSVHIVRDVAPNKLMLCISFRVPAAVAFSRESRDQSQEVAAVSGPRDEGGPSAAKKIKL